MGRRREGREAAVQYLFSADVNRGEGSQAADHWAIQEVAPKARAFAVELAEGVIRHREEIDGRIARCTENYQLHRISTVDRNVLRLAVFEMFHCAETPPIVAINEAIEIAKKFGTADSGRFVNGVLDRVKLEIHRPLRTAAPPPEPEAGEKAEGEMQE